MWNELHGPVMNASKLTKSPVLEGVERRLHPDKQTANFQSLWSFVLRKDTW